MILVTGGAGYIGSHTVVELIEAGEQVVVFDNLSNSSEASLKRVETITGKMVPFVKGDIRSREQLESVFNQYDISAVIHFAGLKEIAESVEHPLRYYENNIYGTQLLLQVMSEHQVKNFIFSSSATVYGDPATVPIREDFPVGATTNPYGTSKYVVERMLADLHISDPAWSITVLRYFNPVGAHHSGWIGENPSKTPANLLPYITQVAVGRLKELRVFGDDYDTHDGTGVRDYIHVVDLAQGHLAALQKMQQSGGGYWVVNLGTGQKYSVLDIIKAFEKASGITIPYRIEARRPGDIAICYADPSYAEQTLGWKTKKGLQEMMEDAWRWQSNNPNGY
jgi:UDP-glucose 4-epimerase